MAVWKYESSKSWKFFRSSESSLAFMKVYCCECLWVWVNEVAYFDWSLSVMIETGLSEWTQPSPSVKVFQPWPMTVVQQGQVQQRQWHV
jgi:hypothetical protein